MRRRHFCISRTIRIRSWVDWSRRVAAREFSAFRWRGTIPNPQEPATFVRSKLNWSEARQPRHAELLEWYRGLIRLRRDKVEVPRESRTDSPQPKVNFDAAADWLTFVHNGVLAVFNLAAIGLNTCRCRTASGNWC